MIFSARVSKTIYKKFTKNFEQRSGARVQAAVPVGPAALADRCPSPLDPLYRGCPDKQKEGCVTHPLLLPLARQGRVGPSPDHDTGSKVNPTFQSRLSRLQPGDRHTKSTAFRPNHLLTNLLIASPGSANLVLDHQAKTFASRRWVVWSPGLRVVVASNRVSGSCEQTPESKQCPASRRSG